MLHFTKSPFEGLASHEMTVISEDGIFLTHHLADKVPPASLSLALNGDHSLGGDDPRPLLGLPRVPSLGRAKHGVLGYDLRSLLAHGNRALHDRASPIENVVLHRIVWQ